MAIVPIIGIIIAPYELSHKVIFAVLDAYSLKVGPARPDGKTWLGRVSVFG